MSLICSVELPIDDQDVSDGCLCREQVGPTVTTYVASRVEVGRVALGAEHVLAAVLLQRRALRVRPHLQVHRVHLRPHEALGTSQIM